MPANALIRCLIFCLVAVTLASPAIGQQAPTPPADTKVEPPPAPKPATLEVRVTDNTGAPREGAVVRLRREGQPDVLQATDANGRYTFRNLTAGQYTLQLVAALPGGAAVPGEQVSLAGDETINRVLVAQLSPAAPQSIWPVVWSVLAYLIALLGFRLFTIAQPARKLLYAQIESVALKLQMEGGTASKGELQHLVNEINQVRKSQEWSLDEYIREPLFWSGGRELTAWRRIHEVERHLVLFLAPSERVYQRALSVEAELRSANTPGSIALADRLRRTLDQPAESRSNQLLKHQLSEALMCAYNEQDNKFASLMEWHNKAMFMVTLALMVVVALTLMFGQLQLFLLGAVGGLMSRMMRSLHREDLPTDYGASWTTLFLSPLLGAIAAWFGIAAIDMLGDMQVLGGVLGTIEWEMPVANAITMFTAFLLGFSERLFMSLLSTVEGRVDTELKEGAARAPAQTRQPSAPGETAPRNGQPTPRPANAAAPPLAPSMSASVVEDLDLTAGERAVFVGDSMSPFRLRLLSMAGADNVVDVPLPQLATAGEADAILIDRVPDATSLNSAAAACVTVLRAEGRLVAVGSTPAGLYDADASTQAQQNVVGPALLHATMTAAGLLAQEPAERLAGPDPVRWSAAFRKP